MSGPKARCPSCGTEWEAPVVFCGECGAPVAASDAPVDRTAHLPGAPATVPGGAGEGGKGFRRAHTLVGALPGIPVSPAGAPPPAERHTVMGMPAVSPSAEGSSLRVPAVTMVSPVTPTDRETKPGPGRRRGRRGSSTNEDALPRSESRPQLPRVDARSEPVEDAPQIEIHEDRRPDPHPPAPTRETAPTVVLPRTPAVVPEAGAPAAAAPPPAPAAAPAAAPGANGKNVRPSTLPPHEADETQRMLEDLDAGFDSIVRPSAPVVWLGSPGSSPPPDPTAVPSLSDEARAARHEADMEEVRGLFAGIAVAYARPLRDFMIEIVWGEPTKEWLDVALPATQALRRAAAAVELPGVDAALEGYQTALELAMGEGTIHREVREMLAGAYAKLVDALPSVFALEGERVRREPIIVRSLLLQVPGVRHVAIEKLYRAGINGLDILYAARPRELAEATGLDEALAAAIVERFQRYRRELSGLSPQADRERERAELARLLADLERQQKAFDAAARSWSAGADAERARARKERNDTVLAVDVLLAHLGEVDLQRRLAKLPFQQKIAELARFLDEARQKAARP